jgi:hypothetical protein
MHTIFCFENLLGRNYSEDLGVAERIILERILGKQFGKMWGGCIWRRIGISGGFL